MEKQLKRSARAGMSWSLIICLIFAMGFGLTFGETTVNATQTGSALSEMKGVKVVEIYSKVLSGSDEIVTDYIPTPREFDEYHRMGIYGKVGVPVDVTELRLKDADALSRFPSADTKYKALAMAISDEVYNGLIKGQGVFFSGADCDTAVGVAGGVRRAYPEARLGLIYIDAHGDILTADTTPSGMLDGMGTATIMGIDNDPDMVDWWNLSSGNMDVFDALLLTDGRDLDQKESDHLKLVSASASHYAMLNTKEFNDKDTWRDAVEAFTDAVDVIYLHVDADVLNQAYLSHMDAGEGNGPTVWTMLDNLRTVMDTGKVAAVNLSRMYTGDTDTELTSRGFTIREFPPETPTERVNRFSQTSLLSAIRIVSAMFEDWAKIPEAPGTVLEIPAAKPGKNGSLKALKIVEIRTRNQTKTLFVSRNLTPPIVTDVKYTYEQLFSLGDAASAGNVYTYEERGTLLPELDRLYADLIKSPRELDDCRLAGIYDNAGIPWDLSQVILTEEQADEMYPDRTRYEALSKEISDEVYTGLMEDKGIVLNGSGCMPTVAAAGGMRRAFGDNAKLGLLYIDAHGDINTLDSTFSGGIGGMDVAPVMGIDPHPTMQEWWNFSSDNGKVFDDLLHACARNLDSGIDTYDPNNPYEFGEMINLKKAVSKEEFILDVEQFNNADTFETLLDDFVSGVDAIYLHIDMDAVDAAFMPNIGSPEGYPKYPGPSIWTMMNNVKTIMETGKVSIVNLASYYPGEANDPERLLRHGFVYPTVEGEDTDSGESRSRVAASSILSGMRVLSTMLGNWESSPDMARGKTIKLTIGDTSYIVNGVSKSLDSAPVIIDGRTMVSPRFIAEAMGASVEWDDATQTAAIALDDKTLRVTAGERASGMDVPAQIMNGRMMIPLRYVSETLGAMVNWDADKWTVEITK